MSRNKDLESKIQIVDELVDEMRNNRDQAKLFKTAADALRILNQEIKAVNEQFDGLNSDEIHQRLKAIENQRDGIRDQLAEFKGEFKGLVDGLSGRVGTLKDDVSGLQSSFQAAETSNRQQLKALEDQFASKIEGLEATQQETASALQSSLEKVDSVSRERFVAMGDHVESLMTGFKASQEEVSSKIKDSSLQTKDLIERSESESRNHTSQVNQQTLEQLKEENEVMKTLLSEHFKTVQKWIVFIALVGVVAAGVAGYLLYLALSTATAS